MPAANGDGRISQSLDYQTRSNQINVRTIETNRKTEVEKQNKGGRPEEGIHLQEEKSMLLDFDSSASAGCSSRGRGISISNR